MKITKANGVVEYQLLAQLKQRAGETDPKITEAVTTIINGVKEGGDEAVREYTVRFDGSVPKKIEFDKSRLFDPGHIELGRRHLGRRVPVNGHDALQGPVGDNDACRVRACRAERGLLGARCDIEQLTDALLAAGKEAGVC